jgi:hypothetical protein
MKPAIALLLFVTELVAQGMKPREKAEDYPVQVQLPKMELAADYLVHSLPGPSGSIFTSDYLVIEVAAYPTSRAGASWATGEFSVRINHKTLLLPQAPGMVAASLKYPDWERRPVATAEAGIGDRGLIIGQPPSVPRFPGDARGGQLPPPPRASDPETPPGLSKTAGPTIEEICQQLAVYDGPFTGPVSGHLYFPFKGKTKQIRSLELLYEAADGTKATLPLL